MIDPHILLYVGLWLLLGLLADKFCERLAKKERRRYEGTTQVACYIAGPVILPIAFAWAILKALLHLIR